MNEPVFGKTILIFWNFARVKATTQNPKCSALDFAVRLHNVRAGPTISLDWWCEHVHCPLRKSLCVQVSKPFLLSWFLATCYPVLRGSQTWASSCVLRSNFRWSFFKPILDLSWEFLSLIFFLGECSFFSLNSSGLLSLKSFFWELQSVLKTSFVFHSHVVLALSFFCGNVVLFWSQFQVFSLRDPCFWNSIF